jgi:glycosyltransferase involved in cell wall biosynthesis
MNNLRGGGEISNFAFLKALKDAGHDVVAYHTDWKPQNPIDIDYEWQGIFCYQRDKPDIYKKAKDFLDSWKPQLIFGMTEVFFRYVWQRNIHYILVVRSPSQTFRKVVDEWQWHSPSLPQLVQRADAVVANSQWVANLYLPYSKRVAVVFPPVLESEYLIQESHPQYLVSLSGTKQKGGSFIAALANEHRDWRFLVAGKKPEKLLKPLPNVGLVGYRKDISQLLAQATVGLHLHDFDEPFGRTLLEFMLNRIPVVSWNRDGPKEILGGHWLACPFGDVSAVTSTISRLLQSSKDYTAAAAWCRSRYEQVFDGKRQLDIFVNLVSSLGY